MAHRGRCLSYGDGVAFWALAEMVRSRFNVLEGDPNEVVTQRMHAGLEQYVADAEERAWLQPRIATLIGVADPGGNTPAFARDDLFAAWRTFLERVASYDDAVGAFLRIDDLQWADEGLLDFIEHVLDTAQAPIFFLTLARTDLTERVPAYGSGRRATALHLEPLPDEAMGKVIDGLVAGLPEAVRATLVERSEGIPLFAVETVRGLIDRDAVIPREGRYILAPDAAERVDLDNLELPTTLHTLIASRLDALPAQERRVVQDAAVLGQAFTRDGLVALLNEVCDQCDLDTALGSLVRKEILAVESDPRSPERGQYRFVQALVRGVAYDTLARRDRKARHLAVAAHLASEPDAETIPSVIATHYLDAHNAAADDPDAAGLAAKAVGLLEQAATRAQALGAPEEARRHLVTALDLVTEDPDKARLTEATARATMALGSPSEAAELAERAQHMYGAAGLDVDAFRALALWGEAQIASGNGQAVTEPLATAYNEVENRAEAAPVAAQLALQCARGFYLSTGDAAASMPWFDRAVLLGEALEDVPLLASTLASYAGAFVLVGRPRMGLGLLRVSLDLARELDDPKIRLKPLNNLVSFLAIRDVARAKEYAEEGLAIVRRLGDREWGLSLAGSAMHVYWTAGDWDTALALKVELGDVADASSTLEIMECYVAAICAARGEPYQRSSVETKAAGMRSDVMLELCDDFLDAARARSAGDVESASDQTAGAAQRWMQLTWIDDDFATLWLIAIDDALTINNIDRARELVSLVEDKPLGHIPPYLRAQLLRVTAEVDAAAGLYTDVERRLGAAASALGEFTAPFYVARCQLAHAEVLHASGRGAEAAPLLADAARGFESLGARPWLARATLLGAGEQLVGAGGSQ